MKPLIILLIAANLAFALWQFLGDPVDIVREPARAGLQIDAERFRILSSTEVGALRTQAEKAAADKVSAAASAPAAPAAAPAEISDVVLPSASCVEVGDFPSESQAKKLRTKLAAIGLSERTTLMADAHATRLRVTGVDSAVESMIHDMLKDFPKQSLVHCAAGPLNPVTTAATDRK